MKKLCVLIGIIFVVLLTACGKNNTVSGNIMESKEILETGQKDIVQEETREAIEDTTPIALTNDNENEKNTVTDNETTNSETEVSNVKIKITVGDTELLAILEDNATTRELISQMPMTLPMMDLYGREMCYRYGAYALPTDNLRDDGYEVGDIAYWAPGGSLVILYSQNGEEFERQHLGHIDEGVEVFETTGDVDVRFELVE